LKRITHDSTRHQRLFKGRQVIHDLWNALPATKHPDIKSQTRLYVMDCHSLSGLGDPTNQAPRGVDGMIIAVHGEFEESGPDGKAGKRSFSRTFVLGPGLPGGNQIRVVSDMLCLRANNPLPNIHNLAAQQQQQPQVQPIAQAVPVVQAVQAAPIQPVQPNPNDLMIAELSKQTRMTAEYARMCLEQAAWNFEHALVLYNTTKATLPPEAFMP
jgi:nuclear RNA export factor